MFGKAVGVELGEDQYVVQDDLEAPASGGDQDQLAEVGLQVLQYICRQTDGFGLVASHGAVLDTHPLVLHGRLRSGGGSSGPAQI